MKELVDEWLSTGVATVLGLIVTGLWGFRERTHGERYTDMKKKLDTVNSELTDLQKEHSVIVERVNSIASRQEKIADAVDKTLQGVARVEVILSERGKHEN